MLWVGDMLNIQKHPGTPIDFSFMWSLSGLWTGSKQKQTCFIFKQISQAHWFKSVAFITKEMHEYVMSFSDKNEKVKPGAHPAEIVPFHLGSNNPENNSQHMKSLELWFAGYQNKRSGMIYKSCTSVVSHSAVLGASNKRIVICCTIISG